MTNNITKLTSEVNNKFKTMKIEEFDQLASDVNKKI